MKALKKARADLEKAQAKRDRTKELLEADEMSVKECLAAVYEAENNEYVGMVRALDVSVEEFAEIVKAMKSNSLASVLAAREEKKKDDEPVEKKAEKE